MTQDLESYRDVSVNGRLVAALRATETAVDAAGIATQGVKAWLEHMWRWLGVEETSFWEWEQWRNEVLDFALGGEPPNDLVRTCRDAEVDLHTVRTLIQATSEIVYGHLFGAIDHERSLRDLGRVAEASERLGGRFLPVSGVRDLPRDAANEWGVPLDDDAINVLRRR